MSCPHSEVAARGDLYPHPLPDSFFDTARMTRRRELTPRTLGKIIALYEHRVFVEGVIWGINSFDQWGVEFGKELANKMLPLVKTDLPTDQVDTSTAGLIGRFRALK